MKTLDEMLVDMGLKEAPEKEISIEITGEPLEELKAMIEGGEAKKKIEVHEIHADLRKIQEEITFILTNCIKMLRTEDEELREAAAQELETWLANANPVKH